jgi:hypothetical protein
MKQKDSKGRGRSPYLILLDILREIFDESAYERFLQLHRSEISRESYAEFLREHELAKVRRPRCC